MRAAFESVITADVTVNGSVWCPSPPPILTTVLLGGPLLCCRPLSKLQTTVNEHVLVVYPNIEISEFKNMDMELCYRFHFNFNCS